MKNLKRVLSLGLASIMLVGMMAVGASAAETKEFTDASEIQNVEAVTTMAALNVINGKDNGSFDPKGNVTRGEMAKMITIIMNGGVEPVLSSNAANPKFSDIGGHWAQKYIEYCAANGIIAGRGDGTFAPDANVTGTEAAKMILTSLNYDSEVFVFTGADWEVNVNSWANGPDAQLYTELKSLNPSAAISRDNAAQMLFNALEAKVVRITYDISSTGTTGKNYSFTNTNTLMVEKFGADKIEGVVTGNEVATIGGGAEDEGETVITPTKKNGASFTTEITVLTSTDAKVLGRNVSVYVKESKKEAGKYEIIGGVVLSGTDTVYTDTTGKEFAKINKKVDTTKADIYPNYGTKDNTATAVAGDTTIMIDNDNDKDIDTIFVVSYSLDQITKIDTKNEKVSFAGLSRQAFDDVVGYEDLEEDDIVLVTLMGGKYYLELAETVEGELTEYDDNDEGETTKLTVDDTTYDVSAADVDANLEAATGLGEAELDVEATFYLDANGMIVARGEAKESATQYAISWGGATGNKLDSNRIKLTLEDGTTGVYTIYSKSDLKIGGDEGQYFTGKDADGNALPNPETVGSTPKSAVGTLVAYSIRSDGTVSLKLAGTTEDNVDFTSGKTLIGSEVSTNSTLFFHVKTDEDTGDVTEVKVYTGYKAAPSVENSTATVVVNAKTDRAVAVALVDPTAGSDKASVANHLYLKSTSTRNSKYINAKAVLAGEDEEVSIRLDVDTETAKGIYLYTVNSDGYYELTPPDTEGDDADKWYVTGKLADVTPDTVITENGDEYFITSNTVEYDATSDGDGMVEKGATVAMVVDTDTDEVLMIVVTAPADDEPTTPETPETETFSASITKGSWDSANSKLTLTASVTGSKGSSVTIKSVKWSKDSSELSGKTDATLDVTTGGSGSYVAEVTYTVGSDTTEKTATAQAVTVADADLQ